MIVLFAVVIVVYYFDYSFLLLWHCLVAHRRSIFFEGFPTGNNLLVTLLRTTAVLVWLYDGITYYINLEGSSGLAILRQFALK